MHKIYSLLASLSLLIIFTACGGGEGSGGGGSTKQSFSLGEPYLRTDNSSNTLLASSKTFKSAHGDGPKITLVGVAHIAEREFYQYVNNRIARADRVLYEAVSSDEPHLMLTSSCTKLLRVLDHSKAARALGLETQSDHVFYPQNKSIRSDRSSESMMDSILHSAEAQTVLAKRGHPQKKSYFDSQRCYAFLHVLQESIEEHVELLKKNGELRYSYVVPDTVHGSVDVNDIDSELRNQTGLSPRAWTAKSIESDSDRKNGPASAAIDRGLVDFRNEAPLKELGRHMYLSSDQEIVLVYGAAHMKHMEAELVRRYNYVPDYEERITLWSY
jgi:hypothetical protein